MSLSPTLDSRGRTEDKSLVARRRLLDRMLSNIQRSSEFMNGWSDLQHTHELYRLVEHLRRVCRTVSKKDPLRQKLAERERELGNKMALLSKRTKLLLTGLQVLEQRRLIEEQLVAQKIADYSPLPEPEITPQASETDRYRRLPLLFLPDNL